ADLSQSHLERGRDRRRDHHRGGREARRVLLGPAARQRHRNLARLRDRPGVPAVPPARAVRRDHHRADLRSIVLYREAGQYKTSYAADQALFPILQDRIGVIVILAAAFVLVPLLASNFAIDSILIPVLVLALAACG